VLASAGLSELVADLPPGGSKRPLSLFLNSPNAGHAQSRPKGATSMSTGRGVAVQPPTHCEDE
jgi:hypothetical protein